MSKTVYMLDVPYTGFHVCYLPPECDRVDNEQCVNVEFALPFAVHHSRCRVEPTAGSCVKKWHCEVNPHELGL